MGLRAQGIGWSHMGVIKTDMIQMWVQGIVWFFIESIFSGERYIAKNDGNNEME